MLTDFFQGWTPPRSCTQTETHRTWGGLPYTKGDFQLTALFELFYPGYMDSAAFRDERGYLVATPHGDGVDVILSDCRPEVLDHYDLIIVAGDVAINREMAYKLRRFVAGGGRVIVAASVPGWRQVQAKGRWRKDGYCFTSAMGRGEIVVVDIPWLLDEQQRYPHYVNRLDESCPLLYDLHRAAKAIIRRELGKVLQMKIRGACMATLSFNDGDRDALLLAVNNTPKKCRTEISFSQSVRSFEVIKENSATASKQRGKLGLSFAPGGIALVNPRFAGALRRRKTVRWDAPLPFKLGIKLNRPLGNLRDVLLQLPSFRNYFDGLVLTPDHFMDLEKPAIEKLATFLKGRGIEMMACDTTPLVNHYPDLSLIGGGANTTEMALAFLASVMEKAVLLGARHLVLPSSKNAEIAFDDAEAIRRIEAFFVKASRLAAHYHCKLHLKPAPHRFFDSYVSMVKAMRKLRLRDCGLWFDLAHDLVMRSYNSSIKHGYPKYFPDPRRASVKEIKNCFPRDYHFIRQEKDHASAVPLVRALGSRVDFVALSAPGADHFGQPLDLHQPINGSTWQRAITAFLKAGPLAGRKIILDIDTDLVRDYDVYFGEWELLKSICRGPL